MFLSQLIIFCLLCELISNFLFLDLIRVVKNDGARVKSERILASALSTNIHLTFYNRRTMNLQLK